MNYLFLHNNCPAQFKHLAATLSVRPDNKLIFLSEYKQEGFNLKTMQHGLVPVPVPAPSENQAEYSYLAILKRGEAFANAMLQLKKQGFVPDLIYDHAGFGCGLFAKDIFPNTPRVSYFEWFYSPASQMQIQHNPDRSPIFFAPERLRNHFQLDALNDCSLGISPTLWQKSQYPTEFHSKIQVVHEGIDTAMFSPKEQAGFVVKNAQAGANYELNRSVDSVDIDLSNVSELLTFTARGLEPCRGFLQFYRSLPAILKARPNCHVVIMGDDRAVYDAPPLDGRSWLETMQAEVELDRSRVHVLSFQPYEYYIKLLQASSVHVYLTVPYVLSWSMLEAMSCGCLVVGSDTEPVRELIKHGVNGLLTPFGDSALLAEQVIEALAKKDSLKSLGNAARASILEKYSVNKVLPMQLKLLANVIGK